MQMSLYKETLVIAEKEFKYLFNVPNYEWKTVNNVDKDFNIYTHEVNQVKTYKVVKELQVNETNLDHFYACLSTIEIRATWCPFFKEVQVKDQPNSHINVVHAKISNDKDSSRCDFVEQTLKKKHHVEFISRSMDDNNLLLCFYIENRFDKANITIYSQKWNNNELTVILSNLLNLKSFPWISHCDKAITIEKSVYLNQEFQLDYIFKEQQQQKYNNNNSAVNILSSQSRNSTFLTSSSLLFSSSPKLNATRVMSSYPDKRQFILRSNTEDDDDGEEEGNSSSNKSKDELRIEVDTLPKLNVKLTDKMEWSNKFAQLCIRCYRRSKKNGYIIQILHPFKLMQYFKQEETMKLDDDEEEDNAEEFIRVHLILDTSSVDTNQFLVNDNEWPIRSWKCDNDTSSSTSEDEEDEDIFVDGMENIIDSTILEEPSSLPTPKLELPPPIVPPLAPLEPAVPVESVEAKLDPLETKVAPKETKVAPIEANIEPAKAKIEPIESKVEPVESNVEPVEAKVVPVESKVVPTESKVVPTEPKVVPAETTQKVKPTVKRQKELQASDQNYSNKTEIPTEDDIDLDEIEKVTIETIIPDNDPVALQKIYPQFSQYINSQFDSPPTMIQSPSKENGQVTIKQFQIQNHPMGGFISESTWKDCSIWDIKSVLESAGARKIWDNTFESTTFLHALTQTSSIWHTKIKGAWPVNPRDYICFHGNYSSTYRIDLLSTSCIGESFQYKPLPKEIPGYIRATIDLMGWRLERLDDRTISVKQVLVTQFSTWVINYIVSRFLVQSCAAVQSAREYLDNFGAPPSLESLTWALLVNLKHDHDKKNWRCEYTRRTENDKENERKPTDSPSTISTIRLDRRRWASGSKNKYSVVVDPPPSRVTAIEKVCDPYGVWLSVEHDEEFIIPLRGKILVLIKPDTPNSSITSECQLNVNGVSTFIEKEVRKAPVEVFSYNLIKDEQQQQQVVTTSGSVVEKDVPPVKRRSIQATSILSEEEQARNAIEQLTTSPRDTAQAALSFLRQTDEQFGWTVIADNNKSGLRVSKKPGTKNIKPTTTTTTSESTEETSSVLVVPDPYMVYKATKVIENFSVEEVAAVVTDINNTRKTYDDTLEHIDLIQDIDPGCRVISQTIKAMFPFKNREVYATSCLAQETSALSNQRTLYIESSIPNFPMINSKKTRGTLYMSGWILEAIDPYTTTTNHPIPSMRVTYVTALDLGNSVPSYISNLVANNWAPKKIQSIESLLKSKGPPPFVTQPTHALSFLNNTLSNNDNEDGIEWLAILTNYDKDKHQYKVNNKLKLDNKAVPKLKDDIILSTSSSTSTTAPLRRPSTHMLTSTDVNVRRGSLPINNLPKKRITTSIEAAKEKTISIPCRSITFLQATFDLRAFTKGYEITAQLYDVTDMNKKKNISSKLTASISEPSLSNLVDGKKKQIKHTILVKAYSLSPPSTATYEFEFSLIPAREETIQNKSNRLTVSDVLGEDEDDKDKWNGIILMNTIEYQIGTDITLKSLAEETDNESIVTYDDKPVTPLYDYNENEVTISNSTSSSNSISSGSNDQDALDEPSMAMQYMGGGVVATALGNVSAGVNNFSARMMLPFRSTPTAFLLPRNEEAHHIEEVASSDDENNTDFHGFTNEDISSATLHEIRLLRRSRDTMRKGMFLLMICLGTAVVLALLMLQPMLERYYASFTASSTIESLDRSIKNGVIRRLVQIPWFGGWDIQIIAVKRGDV